VALTKSRSGVTTLQMRRANQDDTRPGMIKWTCSLCDITYRTDEKSPHCPMCEMYKERVEFLNRMAEAEAKVAELQEQLDRATANVDFVVAIQNATELLGPEDMAWLKSVLYRWRESKNMTLETIEGRNGPKGFLASWRDGTAEEHMVTSVGGVAIAGILRDVSQGFGKSVGLMTVAKAMAQHLKGAM
jgi:rubredoxin